MIPISLFIQFFFWMSSLTDSYNIAVNHILIITSKCVTYRYIYPLDSFECKIYI